MSKPPVLFGGPAGGAMADSLARGPGGITIVNDAEPATVEFWKGDFGSSYTDRHPATAHDIRARVPLWADIFRHFGTDKPKSIMEVGANVGNNLRAIRSLSGARFFGVEPNDKARKVLVDDGVVDVFDAYVGIGDAIGTVDLIFTAGVLIHIPPDNLLDFCRKIHRCAGRWIVAIEYFSDQPREVPYRGHAGKLWTRDFGAFYLDHFLDLKPVACGFAWRRFSGLDSVTYWLFEKRSA